MIYRCILPPWAEKEFPDRKKVLEGEFTDEEISNFNNDFYNIFYLPNGVTHYDPSQPVDGKDIDIFKWVFVDFDLKSGAYSSTDEFIQEINKFNLPPSVVVLSGHGVHVYWEVSDLDPMSYLKIQRRLCRKFKTDEAVSKIFQLMRVAGTKNTKNKDHIVNCEVMSRTNNIYTCEQFDNVLPLLTKADEEYCNDHFNSTYELEDKNLKVDEKLPVKFGKLLSESVEVKELWSGISNDRSKDDYRIGHILFAQGFTKDEAMSVLVNSAKALTRAPKHRINYANNIVKKIWTYEIDKGLNLSRTVRDILAKAGDKTTGKRFPCYTYLDHTARGFRLGQVIGLVAGSGVGKTAVALNMFKGFVELNPDYEHFFIPLEQPEIEIAERWRTMCGENTYLHDKVHVMSNYADDGTYRHLSLTEIKDYLLNFQLLTGKKVGCVVIDHIGALKKKGKLGENQDTVDICHQMKAFAIETDTLLVMQSQTSREKAGIGDIELDKDAAYGTMFFEAYCDYLITMWQPLKRMYKNPACPTVTAFKFCKIRHKKKGVDVIEEDRRYTLTFDPTTEQLRTMTQEEKTSFDYYNKAATNARQQDRKTDILTYTSVNTEGT